MGLGSFSASVADDFTSTVKGLTRLSPEGRGDRSPGPFLNGGLFFIHKGHTPCVLCLSAPGGQTPESCDVTKTSCNIPAVLEHAGLPLGECLIEQLPAQNTSPMAELFPDGWPFDGDA